MATVANSISAPKIHAFAGEADAETGRTDPLSLIHRNGAINRDAVAVEIDRRVAEKRAYLLSLGGWKEPGLSAHLAFLRENIAIHVDTEARMARLPFVQERIAIETTDAERARMDELLVLMNSQPISRSGNEGYLELGCERDKISVAIRQRVIAALEAEAAKPPAIALAA